MTFMFRTTVGFAVFGVATASAQVRVDERGGLGMDVPIEVPSFYDLTPDVRLAYHASESPGLAGSGWSVTGASVITRTSATGGVAHMDASDKFWLDGVELIPCTSTSQSPSCTTAITAFGSVEGVYSTAQESYRRIRVRGATWTVWDRNGTSSIYSGDTDGSYLLRSKIDTHGNLVHYGWTCTTACDLDSISYGGTPGTEVHFYRELRPDFWRDHGPFGSREHRERLRSIVVKNNGGLLRAYQLGYVQSRETQASLLASVQQFGTDAVVDGHGGITGGTSLPPRTFTAASQTTSGSFVLAPEVTATGLFTIPASWQPLTQSIPTSIRAGADVSSDFYSANDLVSGDFDGDGRVELASYALHDNCKQVRIRTFGNGTPVDSVRDAGTVPCVEGGQRATTTIVADVTGDGADDLLLAFGNELHRYEARGDGTFVDGPTAALAANAKCQASDVDGDGRDDLVCDLPQTQQIQIMRAVPGSWLVSTVSIGTTATRQVLTGDVDGDGLSDLVVVTSTSIELLRSSGDGTFAVFDQQVNDVAGDAQLADMDGDGHADLVWTHRVANTIGTQVTIALARKGHSARWQLLPMQTTQLQSVTFADVDGDGRSDLVGIAAGQQLAVQRTGDLGVLGSVAPTTSTCGDRIVAADWNGDGLADPTCVTFDSFDGYRIAESPSQPLGADRHRWQHADLDGDGQEELVYIAYNNPSYTIYVIDPRTNTRRFFIIPNTFALAEPDASRWVVADVGSPAGPADGKADLTLVSTVNGRMIVTTLLSLGEATFSVNQQDVGASGTNTRGWFGTTFDRTGKHSLARVVSLGGAASVEELRPVGPGQWVFTSSSYYGSGSEAPLGSRAAHGFLPVDVDADGLTDLVAIDQVPGQALMVRALVRAANGSFTEEVSTFTGTAIRGAHTLHFADLDGDGLVDLFHAATIVTPNADQLAITELAGDGRGGFAFAGTHIVTPSSGDSVIDSRLFEDAAMTHALDLDHDGTPELAQITHAVDLSGTNRLFVTTLHELGGSWTTSTFALPLAYDLGDSWSWTPYQDSTTGDVGLSYIHPDIGMVLRWDHVSDEMIADTNGLGLGDAITYRQQIGARTYLPSGFVPRVVASVTTTDTGELPATSTTTQYTYGYASWSDARRMFLGFAVKAADDQVATQVSRYQLTDECGAQQTSSEVSTSNGPLLSVVSSTFVAPGAAAPYTCQEAARGASECASGTCQATSGSQYTYDAYGSTTKIVTIANGAPTTLAITQTDVAAIPYILSRPYGKLVMGIEHAALQVKSRQRFSYDGQPWSAAPIRGDLTRVDTDELETNSTLSTLYTYNADGSVESETAGGPVTRYRYDTTVPRYRTATCVAALCTEQTWNYLHGTVETETAVNHATRVTHRDELSRVVNVEYPQTGSYVTTTYFSTGAAGQHVQTRESAGVVTTRYYDGLGRTYLQIRGDGSAVATQYADNSTRPSRVSRPYDLQQSGPTMWTETKYDALGRPVLVTLPTSRSRSTSYLIGKTITTNELGYTETVELDGLGRAIARVDRNGNRTTYERDSFGAVTATNDPLNNREEHTIGSRRLELASFDPDRRTRTYAYTNDGQLQSIVDEKGQTITYVYDDNARLLRITYADRDGNEVRIVEYIYDDGSNPHGQSTGLLVEIADQQGDVKLDEQRWYDVLGRVIETQRCVGKLCMSTGQTYDLAGRIGTREYPDSDGKLHTAGAESVPYAYDAGGRLTSMGTHGTFEYDIDDNLTRITLANRVVEDLKVDPARGSVEAIHVTAAGRTVAEIDYGYDALGRIERENASGALSGVLTYAYDPVGRLTSVDSFDQTRREEFQYDEIGRMTYQTALGTESYDDQLHRHAMTSSSSGGSRRYDDNGNTIELVDPDGRKLSLQWTTDDKLAKVIDSAGTETSSIYDASGARVRRESAGNVTMFFGPFVELDPRGVLTRSYYAAGHLLERTGTTATYFIEDARGAVRLVFDAKPRLIEADEYAAFGGVAQRTGSAVNETELGCSRLDANVGLYTMGARTYDPVLGQFLSADSIVPSLARPQSFDRYSYVENDPINFADPSGHMRALVEYRKLGISETPGVPTVEEAFAGLVEAGLIGFSYGPSLSTTETEQQDVMFRATERKDGKGWFDEQFIHENEPFGSEQPEWDNDPPEWPGSHEHEETGERPEFERSSKYVRAGDAAPGLYVEDLRTWIADALAGTSSIDRVVANTYSAETNAFRASVGACSR